MSYTQCSAGWSSRLTGYLATDGRGRASVVARLRGPSRRRHAVIAANDLHRAGAGGRRGYSRRHSRNRLLAFVARSLVYDDRSDNIHGDNFHDDL